MPKITNPILPGFNPDPSICHVGDTYYIATSTFEWFPGVQIHASKDLANWELVARPLERADQLDMRGDPDSGGVWAPCLSYADGQFWLIYTDMKRHHGSFKDAMNYLVTAPAIEGPWSAGTFLNGAGFDPSLFHDDNGRKWYLQMLWDHRSRPKIFAGITIQEFDPAARKLVGERRKIYDGTDLGLTEGPHLYKRNGYYYLLTAEGGTGYEHACTLSRSKNLFGPFEDHPDKYIVTAKDDPLHPIQKAGHGDLVETPDGDTYLVHLMSRPVTQKRRSVLGRETALQKAEWRDDGWLYLVDGPLPAQEVEVPGTPLTNDARVHYDFIGPDLPMDFQWQRTPFKDRLFTLTNPGLRLIGRESIGSWNEQSLLARRQDHFDYRAETELSFDPADEREMAGLTAYYSRHAFYYLAVTADSDGTRELLIMAAMADNPTGRLTFPADPVPIPDGPVKLAVTVQDGRLQFAYATTGNFIDIGPDFDATILSDEASVASKGGCFTGAFVGIAAQDVNGGAKPADFSYFEYEPL